MRTVRIPKFSVSLSKVHRTFFILVAAILAAGTVVERIAPQQRIYSSWWFVALMAVVAAVSVAAIVKGRMWKKLSDFLIHSAIVLILAGGGITFFLGLHDSITLHPNTPNDKFDSGNGSLPFCLTLQHFEVIPYAGTHTPMDFVSHIEVDGQQYDISMNHILRYRGYRFYQEDYGEGGTSTLSVAHDPAGIAVTYCGYALLVIGLLLTLVHPGGRYRQLLRGAMVVALLMAASPLSAQQLPPTLPRETAEHLGRVQVLYKGRVCPLQTYAKDFTTKLTGSATYRGLSSEQVLSGYLFYFGQWADEPAIKIKGDEVRQQLGIDGKRTSYNSLAAAERSGLFEAKASHPRDRKLRAASEKYSLIEALLSGKGIKIFPVADSTGSIGWYGQNDPLPIAVTNDEYIFIRSWQGYCQELVLTSNIQELERVFDKTAEYQHQRAASILPTAAHQRAERLYNALTTGRWLPMTCITLGLLMFAFALRRQASRIEERCSHPVATASRVEERCSHPVATASRVEERCSHPVATASRIEERCSHPVATASSRTLPRWLHTAAAVYLSVLTNFLLLIFVLRWIVGGHAPMAGGFDSMNLMAIIIGLAGLLLAQRHPMALPSAMLAMGFALLVAMINGSNPPVTNLMPVLNSPLLSLHVAVIMGSYALFFFVMLCGVAGLIGGGESQRRLCLLLLYPAVFLLALGIIIGAVWANISWGSYWTWDPKEVWALITLIVYAIPLHPTLAVSRKPRAFYLYCTLAFLSVIVTYFGVNLLLGGMHAYN